MFVCGLDIFTYTVLKQETLSVNMKNVDQAHKGRVSFISCMTTDSRAPVCDLEVNNLMRLMLATSNVSQ